VAGRSTKFHAMCWIPCDARIHHHSCISFITPPTLGGRAGAALHWVAGHHVARARPEQAAQANPSRHDSAYVLSPAILIQYIPALRALEYYINAWISPSDTCTQTVCYEGFDEHATSVMLHFTFHRRTSARPRRKLVMCGYLS
jgi:hypothetical protein